MYRTTHLADLTMLRPPRSRWRGMGVSSAGLIVVAAFFVTPGLTAEPRIETVEIGFGGLYKVGYFAPVQVTVAAGNRDFRGLVTLEATDTDGAPTTFIEPEQWLEIRGGQSRTVWRYVKPGRTSGIITVRLRDADGRTIATRQTPPFQVPLRSTRRLVLTTGPDSGIEDVGRYQQSGEEKMIAVAQISDAASFPDRWYGYEGVDTLLITTSEPGSIEQMSGVQAFAMLEWIRLGGRVVISVGRRAEQVFAAEHRLFDLRPGQFIGMKSPWSRTGLEQFSKAAQPIAAEATGAMALFDELLGDVECFEGAGAADERALIIRRPFGLGQVRVIAVDVDRDPIASWRGRPRLFSRLTGISLDEDRDGTGGRVAHIGYEDLIGQLRGSLDRFDGITIIRFSWVAGLIVIYMLLIGPAEYFGLRRIGRSHLTWITFPTVVALFCLLAYGLASKSKGRRMLVNQIDLVDVDVTDSTVRGTTWTNIYSPRGELLDLSLHIKSGVPEAGDIKSLLTWQGLPGRGLGGMDTTSSDTGEARPYEIMVGGRNGIRHMPLHGASSKGLFARWWDSTRITHPEITSDGLGLLHGELTNPLHVELSQVVILHDKWLFSVSGRLAPGGTIRLDDLSPRDLNWQLAKRSLNGTHEVTKAWDETDVSEIDRILEMVMFHRAAGGPTYTRLDHHYQSEIDLSEHLQAGRAILVGQAAQGATELKRGDRSMNQHINRQWTYYRVVFPVTRTGEIPEVEEPRGRL